MLMRFKAEDIVAHRVLADGSGAGISFKSGEDTIELILPPASIQGAAAILADVLEALTNIGAKLPANRGSARFPQTVTTYIAPELNPPGVAVVFDPGQPTQCIMAMSAIGGRTLGRDLLLKARQAEKTPHVEPPMPAINSVPADPKVLP